MLIEGKTIMSEREDSRFRGKEGHEEVQPREQREHWEFESVMLRLILTILSAAILGFTAWVWNVDREVKILTERTTALTQSLSRVETTTRENRGLDRNRVTANEVRLRTLESLLVRQDERDARILESLERMSSALDELTRRLNRQQEE